ETPPKPGPRPGSLFPPPSSRTRRQPIPLRPNQIPKTRTESFSGGDCSSGSPGGSVAGTLFQVTDQAPPGEPQSTIENIEFGRLRGQRTAHLARNPFNEKALALVGRLGGMQPALVKSSPIAEAIAGYADVLVGTVDVSEMRQKEALGVERHDGIERSVPQFQIDVGRRGGRQEIRFSFDSDAGGVAHKRDPRAGIPVGNVVRGMSGGVKDIQMDLADADGFAALERIETRFRNGQAFAVQDFEVGAVEAAGAG